MENKQDKRKLLLWVVAFALVLVVAVAAYNGLSGQYPEGQTAAPSSQPSQAPEGSGIDKEDFPLAPDFSVEDADGNTVKLSDFRGTPVVVNFWASWCGPCRIEMPHFEALGEEYQDQVIFLMVNLTDGNRETKEAAQDFLAGEGYHFSHLVFDTNSEAAYQYRVSSIPTTYFIDAQGYALSREIGSLSEQTLRGRVETLLPAQ